MSMQVEQFGRALVLGGTGMIGAHAVRACLERGIAVRVLVRRGSDRRNLQGLNLETVMGDLADAASLGAALRDCDLLIHAAAPYPKQHFGKRRLLADARAGMGNLLAVARSAVANATPLRRLVYVSSVTTIGRPAGSPQRPAREEDCRTPIPEDAPYFAVKNLLEGMALEAAGEGLPVVVVNPTFCVDEFDSHQTTAQLMVPLARRQIPAYLPGRLNAVPTRDVGEGILQAAQRGRIGERYILGGENMTSREFLQLCARVAGVPAPSRAMPLAAAEVISMATEVLAHLTRTRPLFPLTGIRMMKHSQAYDITRAREELGFAPSSLTAAVERAYAWYRAEGLL